MSFQSLDDLRAQLDGRAPILTREYREKMMHPIPTTTAVDRAKFVLERVTGKAVLEFGASGQLHEAIVKVAARCVGVDRVAREGVIGLDLDAIEWTASEGIQPELTFHDFETGQPEADGTQDYKPDLIVCGELLEHLSNPGWFLTRLRRTYPTVPVIITTPNAFSKIARSHAEQGTENVNIDHVSWYSPRTLRTLLERVGYGIAEFHWYGGDGPTASGIVLVTGVAETHVHTQETQGDTTDAYAAVGDTPGRSVADPAPGPAAAGHAGPGVRGKGRDAHVRRRAPRGRVRRVRHPKRR